MRAHRAAQARGPADPAALRAARAVPPPAIASLMHKARESPAHDLGQNIDVNDNVIYTYQVEVLTCL